MAQLGMYLKEDKEIVCAAFFLSGVCFSNVNILDTDDLPLFDLDLLFWENSLKYSVVNCTCNSIM